MDYMLYIIAGLVIIVVIAVLVLRKNKAQQPPTQQRQTDSNIKNGGQTATTNIKPSVANSVEDSSTKFFDNLAVAQRFIDQQRYDKALEILKRGLIQKPHENQLSIKLLNVYALTNQKEDFDNTYTDIETYGDTATIEHAQKLKSLMDAEQADLSNALPKDSDKPSAFESLDFDIARKQSSASNNTTKVDTHTSEQSSYKEASTANANLNKDSINADPTIHDNDDAFDLILSDLETADLEQDTLESSPTDSLEDGISKHTDMPISAAVQLDSATPATDSDTTTSSNTDSTSDNIDDDFTLDFDLDADDTSVASATDNTANEQNFSDDDFVLDFDDLTEDTDSDISSGIDSDSNSAVLPTSLESTDDDFTLFIDETDFDLIDEANTSAPTTEDTSLEESNVENTTVEPNALSFDEELSADLVSPTPAAAAPTVDDNVRFDDDTVINDLDFDTGSDTTDVTSTTLTPVVLDSQNKDTLSSADFAAQFAADFDFVKTLDNNQVTLDLANQYLHLGEYDSAKRLLNEVMTQGNSDQQQQAQELLARTA